MYGNSKMNNGFGYPSTFRSSGARLWGMSHSLPSGISNYASAPLHYNNKYNPRYNHQDNDFTYTRARMFDLPSSSTFGPGGNFGSGMGSGGGGGGGQHHHNRPHSTTMLGHPSSSSTSSLAGAAAINSQQQTNLIVNYLPQDMTERELFSLFTTMGPIESCKIMRDLKTGYSFGFGFINYVNEESAHRAIKCLNGYTVRNKRIKVSFARPPGEEIKETNLYITNLPRNITEEWLDTIFGKYGTIVQKNILRDKLSGSPRGVAFVRYNKREEAQEAISALHNVIPQGGNQPLQVRIAEEHGRAKAALYLPAYNQGVHNRGRFRKRPY
uniref:CSON012287 protein n=1 Tax=Culicoides sonorensis TaxID=179676 RepID=A0A336LN38_CULSO